MRPKGSVEFEEELVRQVPELVPLYEEHIRDNGELLTFVLMDRISDYVRDLFVGPSKQEKGVTESTRDVTGRILTELEAGLDSGSKEIIEVINASFLGWLPMAPELWKLMSPTLRLAWEECNPDEAREWHQQQSHGPGSA